MIDKYHDTVMTVTCETCGEDFTSDAEYDPFWGLEAEETECEKCQEAYA